MLVSRQYSDVQFRTPSITVTEIQLRDVYNRQGETPISGMAIERHRIWGHLPRGECVVYVGDLLLERGNFSDYPIIQLVYRVNFLFYCGY